MYKWALPVKKAKPRPTGMSDEVTSALAALGAEFYRLRVTLPLDLVAALVRVRFWVQDIPPLRDLSDQEK